MEKQTENNPPVRTKKKASLPEWEAENRLAKAAGFACEKDERRGRGTYSNWCRFVKGNVWVWRTSHGWTRALLVEGTYIEHEYYAPNELKRALGLQDGGR